MARVEEKVGFVGVGLMGHGMAKNIVEKGYPLSVIAHRNRKPIEDLVARGAHEASSLAELAERSTIVFLCVTGASDVEQVVGAMLPALRPGSVIVDCSTSDPTVSARVAETLARHDVGYADAPLARTPKHAWEGRLDTMIGADEATFERIRPVVGTWAGKIIHIGGVGDGHRMKLLNNFVLLGMGALFSEALVLAQKVGISTETFDSIIRGGRADSSFYQTFIAYAKDGDRNSHIFTLANAYKDLRYCEAMANAVSLPTPLASTVKSAYAGAVARGGNGSEDYVPHLVDFVASAGGVERNRPKD